MKFKCTHVFFTFLLYINYCHTRTMFEGFYEHIKDSMVMIVSSCIKNEHSKNTVLFSPGLIDTLVEFISNGPVKILIVGDSCPQLLARLINKISSGSAIDCLCYGHRNLEVHINQAYLKNIHCVSHNNWRLIEKNKGYYDYVICTTPFTSQLAVSQINGLLALCTELLKKNAVLSYFVPVDLLTRGTLLPDCSTPVLEWFQKNLIVLQNQSIKDTTRNLIAEKKILDLLYYWQSKNYLQIYFAYALINLTSHVIIVNRKI